MIARLVLPAPLRTRILDAARDAAPRECCGLIAGWVKDDIAHAAALHPSRNRADRGDRFEIDAQDHFDALRGARALRQRIIGCYHSHPGGGAEPSATDLSGAGEDNFLWLIAGGDALAAFVYFSGVFSNVAIGADLVTSS